jgi:hypothetical protein
MQGDTDSRTRRLSAVYCACRRCGQRAQDTASTSGAPPIHRGDLTGVEHCMDLEDFGRQLRQHVYDCTRLTIGVGAGPTKTLAKSAQWASKEWKQFRGVLALTRGILSERGNCFHCSRSKRSGAWETVLHASSMFGHQDRARSGPDEPGLHPKNFSVVLERTVRELNGKAACRLRKPHHETADCLQPQFWRENHGVRFAPPGCLSVRRAGLRKAA